MQHKQGVIYHILPQPQNGTSPWILQLQVNLDSAGQCRRHGTGPSEHIFVVGGLVILLVSCSGHAAIAQIVAARNRPWIMRA